MRYLRLDRPLVVFDLETTGTDPAQDRIVEIAALKVAPAGDREAKRRLINPERPIPPGATAVHGITDADVRDAPTFRMVARSLLDWLGDADLGGFNLLRFDLPLLEREFRDCRLDLALDGRRVIDAMTVFHRKEPRDLAAAVRFYLGRELDGAHSAAADAAATLDVLEAQLERYDDLPRTVDELHAWIRAVRPHAVDVSGKFVWHEREVVFAFGKHQGKTLRAVAAEAPDYLQWILGSDFPEDAKRLVGDALRGEFPGPGQST
ncbi:MAG TPA: 3'-5' exonuclease [Candidatus Polarisedimenticolaceae bacterium]|nr:3'-5' exonuclease [Candidatus Polarisedimenticolaceae bacterium]